MIKFYNSGALLYDVQTTISFRIFIVSSCTEHGMDPLNTIFMLKMLPSYHSRFKWSKPSQIVVYFDKCILLLQGRFRFQINLNPNMSDFLTLKYTGKNKWSQNGYSIERSPCPQDGPLTGIVLVTYLKMHCHQY